MVSCQNIIVMDACYPSIQETEVQGPLMRPVWATCWDRISKTEQNKRNPFLLEGWRVFLDASTRISTQSCTKYSWNTGNGISLPAFLTKEHNGWGEAFCSTSLTSKVKAMSSHTLEVTTTPAPASLLLWKASKV